MLLKDVTVKTILNGKYHKLWEQMGKKFVLKMKNRHNLSDGEVKMLVEMLNDKGVVGQGIDFYKETISNQGVVGGGAKKKSRRRKKKKKAKKTKKRYRRGGSGPDEISPALIILGIISVTVVLFVSWWEDRRHNNPDIAIQMDRQQNRRSGRVSAEETERRHQQRLFLRGRGDFTGHQGVTIESSDRARDRARDT
jgi:hypothetical protein